MATLKKARKNKSDVPRDMEAVRSLKDNDKLFAYALADDEELSSNAISAITDPLAIHRLIELNTERIWILTACAMNPCRPREDLDLLMQYSDADTKKIIISKLTKQDEILDMVNSAPGSGTRLFAVRFLKGPDYLEKVIDDGHVEYLPYVCARCGTAVTASNVLQGTIEPHLVYSCSKCGYTVHSTIHVNQHEYVILGFYKYVI